MSLLTKILGTPEERKRRLEEQVKARAEARARLAAFWGQITRLPPPILAALIALIGIFIGNTLARSGDETKWHKERLTQLYSDCMYYSFRVESEFTATETPDWSIIRDDVAQMLRSANLLFAYMKGGDWDKMNNIISTTEVYSLSYAELSDAPIRGNEAQKNSASKLRQAAHDLSDFASTTYRFDSRIFGW